MTDDDRELSVEDRIRRDMLRLARYMTPERDVRGTNEARDRLEDLDG